MGYSILLKSSLINYQYLHYDQDDHVKEAAYMYMYNRLVHPVLKYGSSVMDPYTLGLHNTLEKEEGSMNGILGN